MKKSAFQLIRLLFGFLSLMIALLVLIIAIKTMRFSTKQIAVDPIPEVAIDKQASHRLSAAVRLPTISFSDKIDTSAFLALDTLIKASFPLVDSLLESIPVTAFSHVFRWSGRQSEIPPVLLLAHLDVVPVEEETLSKWTYPPFSGEIADGFIWGRGTMDDKISAFAILEAIEQLLAENYAPNRTVYLAFGHDEEVSGFAGAKTIAAHFAKEGIEFEYVLDEGQIILENALNGLAAPLAMIGIAEKGYLTLELKVELAEGGHSSMPPAETAIGILSSGLNRLQESPFPAKINGASQGLLEYAGPEMSPLYKTLFANLWLTKPLLISQLSQGKASNAIIRTTTAPTVIQGGVRDNVLPTQAFARINFRILPGETVESVRAYVQNKIDDERIQVYPSESSGTQNPSNISDTDTFGFHVLQKTIQEVFPKVVVAPALVIAATDSRFYQSVSKQVYRFQPLYLNNSDLSRIHGIDERISLDGYDNAIRFYLQLIKNSTI